MTRDAARFGIDIDRGWSERLAPHDIARFRSGTRRYVHLAHPDYIEHVLFAGRTNYHKSLEYETLRALLGLSLLTDEDESWQWHRTLLNPMFAKRRLNGLVDLMIAPIAELAADIDSAGAASFELSMSDAMVKLTLNVVGSALFGTQFGDIADKMSNQVTAGLRGAERAVRLFEIVAPPRWLFRAMTRAFYMPVPLPPPYRAMQAVIRSVDQTVWQMIGDRQANPTESPDLLNYLLAAKEEDGSPLPDKRVRDESMTFMLAGHETTANALSWMWYLLALNPSARDRMLAEIDETLQGNTPTVDDLAKLPWTTACVLEAMRYYSPAHAITRVAVKPDNIDGHRIREGTTVMIATHKVHHDPRWWPNPEQFDPSRFLPGADKNRPRCAYLPFGGGKRVCIGQSFAVMEAVLATAILSQRFVFDAKPGHPVCPEATLTLRPRYGLPMIARRRPQQR